MTENDYLKRHRRHAWPVSTSCTYASIKHACDFGRCRNRSQYVSCGSADLHSHSYIEPCLYEMRIIPTFFVRWKNNLQVSRQNVHLACHFSRLKFPHRKRSRQSTFDEGGKSRSLVVTATIFFLSRIFRSFSKSPWALDHFGAFSRGTVPLYGYLWVSFFSSAFEETFLFNSAYEYSHRKHALFWNLCIYRSSLHSSQWNEFDIHHHHNHRNHSVSVIRERKKRTWKNISL